MKTRTRELARPGIYGTVDDPKVVSERELREIAETFPEIGRAPVSLNGHWLDPSKPRLGNVTAVSFDDATKTLIGTIEEQDALADAVDEGFFPDVSIGGKRRASDGKMYLHHLAYLGEEPPAVKNLVSDILGSLSVSAEDEDGIAASDRASVVMIPSLKSPRLLLSDPAGTNNGNGAGESGDKKPKEAKPMPKTLEEVQAELTASNEENARFKKQLGDLAKKYPDAGIQLSDSADPRVDSLVRQIREGKKSELLRAASGKVPKDKQDLVVALADSFTTGETIELSDGDKKVSRSQFDVLTDLLAAIPKMVDPGQLALSDGDDGEGRAPVKPVSVPFSKA